MKNIFLAVAAIILACCAISTHAQCNAPWCRPSVCADSSGSGTAQSCTTGPLSQNAALGSVLVPGNTIMYSTTTTNTGDVTVNVNGTGAVHIRKWQGSATLAAGDLVANVPTLLTYDGSSWEMYSIGNAPNGGGGSSLPWSMLAPATITAPVMSEFTGGNLSATSTTYSTNSAGGIFISGTGTTGNDNIAFYYKSAPSPPWTLIVGFVPQDSVSNWTMGGLVIRDSGSGKLIALFVGNNTDNSVVYLGKYNAYAAGYAGSYINSTSGQQTFGPIVWARLQDNGTNYIWSTSLDGQSWIQLWSASVTDFLPTAANEIGIGIDPIINSATVGTLFVDWNGI